ncbi:MAG: iron-containing redox enzyme family protein, partial [Proteobacteria bacterium]
MTTSSKIRGFAHQSEIQQSLTLFNRERLSPTLGGIPSIEPIHAPSRNHEFRMLCKESEFLQEDLAFVQARAAQAPLEAEAFIRWFEDLKQTGPGQGDPLFP